MDDEYHPEAVVRYAVWGILVWVILVIAYAVHKHAAH
jgi:hypothetical protein